MISGKILAIIAAYFLDLLLGDPQWYWHPARIIGRLIICFEKILNTDKLNKRLAGVFLVILVVGLTIFLAALILRLAWFIQPIAYYLFLVLSIYFVLSVKSLGQEAGKVYQALSNKDILGARKRLSMIVARDTQELDEENIIRAAVETTAESIMDGVIAPLFYIFLGGAILAWGYKAINTLDSMVGYKNQRFIDFGWASARLDALVNFIPAKLTCICIFLSSICLGKNWLNSGRCFLRYLFKGTYYNSEATEAVMAEALGVQLGGLNFYSGVPTQKAPIGEGVFHLEIKHIKEAISITYFSSALFVATGIYLIWLLGGR